MPNIAIVWDFDGTLTHQDSTTVTVETVTGQKIGKEFWDAIKRITGKKEKPEWKDLLGSDAPAWMYTLSRMAHPKKIPLNSEFFGKYVVPNIELFPNTLEFLKEIKNLSKRPDFKAQKLEVHHFIISAGLKELIELIFPKDLITHTFGCRYSVVVPKGYKGQPENIPVVCMDETMKTRSLFEISKNSFNDPLQPVNKKVSDNDRFALFSNFIYVGDGETDIPALTVTRRNGGLGVAVFNPKKSNSEIKEKLKGMSLDSRADLITSADYSLDGELFQFIKSRCIQIKQRYEAENFGQ